MRIRFNRLFIGLMSGGILGAVLICYGILIEPYDITVNHIYLDNRPAFKKYSGIIAVQLSDLHIAKVGERERRVIKILNRLNPDIIFLTGDYIRWRGEVKPAITFFKSLKAKIGIWGVMGDYEYSNSRRSCIFCHKPNSNEPTQAHPVKFLQNSFDQIPIAGGKITVFGMDGNGQEFQNSDQKLRLSQDKQPLIILCHNPLTFRQIDAELPVLMLSGDTHGGQIALPLILFKLFGYQKNWLYNSGFYQENKKMLYVNRGIGTSHIPIRIGRKPEITVFHF